MLKRFIIFLIAFNIFLVSRADEGMWLPSLLKQMNEKDMQALGMKITAEDLYSVNQSSLKDAIVQFGGGCTGEVVSSKGLLFTNHHCGYSYINRHSTVENNYLKNGFWAKSLKEEIPCKGLTVKFIIRIEEVTDKIIQNQSNISESIKQIKAEAIKGTHYNAEVKAFDYGRKYYLFVTEIFKDIRMVGAPPSGVGKFGGESDNWVWPRHTGDFSIFRIYASKDNKPADYNENNIPFKPRKFLKISIEGTKEGDFTMVYGFPGTTEQHLTAQQVTFIQNNLNPARIEIRDVALEVLNNKMQESDAMKLKYAAKVASIANGYKKWQGQSFGLIKNEVIGLKENEEKEFIQKLEKTEYSNRSDIIKRINNVNKQKENYELAVWQYYDLRGNGSSLFKYVASFEKLFKDDDEKKLVETSKKLKTYDSSYKKNVLWDVEKELFNKTLAVFDKNLTNIVKPDILSNIINEYSTWENYTNYIFENSIFIKNDELQKILSYNSSKKNKVIEEDPLYKLVKGLNEKYSNEVLPNYRKYSSQLNTLMNEYVFLKNQISDTNIWHDANSTLRVSYGQIQGSNPRDGISYQPYTTANGILEKYIKNDADYDAPDNLIKLFKERDFGRYANKSGDLPIAFTATNHTTGGNSGSPVLDANGNLIGINFDRSWESTMSDIKFSDKLCRNISVDIRYVLYIIDKYAEASNLIDEMDIIEYQSDFDKEKELLRNEIKIYSNLINDNPSNADFYAKLANAYYELGDLKQSLTNWEKAVKLNPKNKNYDSKYKFIKKVIEDIEKIPQLENQN